MTTVTGLSAPKLQYEAESHDEVERVIASFLRAIHCSHQKAQEVAIDGRHGRVRAWDVSAPWRHDERRVMITEHYTVIVADPVEGTCFGGGFFGRFHVVPADKMDEELRSYLLRYLPHFAAMA